MNDDLALKVLKALFLLKYVKGFPSTLDNITRIMLPTLDTDFPAYRSDIQEALNKLVRPSYIEKGAKRILLPVADMMQYSKVPADLISKFILEIYSDPVDAAFKALGIK